MNKLFVILTLSLFVLISCCKSTDFDGSGNPSSTGATDSLGHTDGNTGQAQIELLTYESVQSNNILCTGNQDTPDSIVLSIPRFSQTREGSPIRFYHNIRTGGIIHLDTFVEDVSFTASSSTTKILAPYDESIIEILLIPLPNNDKFIVLSHSLDFDCQPIRSHIITLSD